MRIGPAIMVATWLAGSLTCAPCAADDWLSSLFGDHVAAAQSDDSDGTKDSVVERFYRQRYRRLAWTGSGQAEEDAQLARDVLAHAYEQGLRNADYTATAQPPGAEDGDSRYDVSLTTAVLRYAVDVRLGRVRLRSIDLDVDLPQNEFDVAIELARALRRNRLGSFFQNLPPPQAQYRVLVEALAAERKRPGGGDRAKMQRLIANMERWRWMPRDLERRYIEVNVPAQSLRYIRDGEPVLDSRVVIGRKNSRTPIMRTEVTSIVTNPPCDIPDDIAARKILPKLRQSSNYLAAKDMILADGPADDPHGEHIDWRHVDPSHLPFQIRQNPGGTNALGSLMLDSPNKFGVYMHDTPSKHLFTLDDREVSNGCIRVQRIFELASLALKDDTEEALPELTEAVAAKETQHIALDTPLPAYVVYWTVVPKSNGTIAFLPDLYGRDRRLIARLTGRSQTSS